MNRLKIISTMLFLFGCGFSHAQIATAVIPVYSCENPGVKAITSGLNSSNYLQGIIPTCTVTVYLTGTSTLATLYKDSDSTPQNNPFKANTDGSIPPIYTALGNYDVVLSGGIPPNTYPQPVTLTGLGSGGGGGSSLPTCQPNDLLYYQNYGSAAACTAGGLTFDGQSLYLHGDGTGFGVGLKVRSQASYATAPLIVLFGQNGSDFSVSTSGYVSIDAHGDTTTFPTLDVYGNNTALLIQGDSFNGSGPMHVFTVDHTGAIFANAELGHDGCATWSQGNLGSTGTACGSGGGSISGTFTHLGQIGSGGTSIIDSPISLVPSATFTATVAGSALTSIVVTSGTPTVGQVVYSAGGLQTTPLVLTAYNAGAATGTLNVSTGVNATGVAFSAHGSTINPQAFQPKSINGVFQSSQIAPAIGGRVTSSITSYSIASNVLTLTGSFGGNYPATTSVAVGAFPTSTFLNGLILPTITSNSTTITAAFTHANVGTTTEAGLVTNSGVQTALFTPDCTTTGCLIFEDPLDQNPTLPASGWTPNASVTNGLSALCFSANICQFSSLVQNSNYGNATLQALGGVSYGTAFGANMSSNWDGYVGQYGTEGVINQGIVLGYTSHTSASIDNILSISNQVPIAKAGDVNIVNINGYYNNAALFAGDEGVVGFRDYMNEYGTMAGTVAAGSGAGSQTLRFVSTNGNASNIAIGTSLVDTTAGVLTGTVTYSVGGTVTVPIGLLAQVATTGMTYGASVQGNVVAQTNIEGLLFAATTTGSAAASVNVLFSTAGALSYTCSSSSNNIVVNIVPGTTTLANIISLFSGGGCVTLAGGITSVSLGYGASGSTLATTYTTAKTLATLTLLSPATTTFVMYSPSAPTTSSLLSLITGYGSQFIYPSTVVSLGNGLYAITAPLQRSQVPGMTCQGGLVGARLELPDYTTSSSGVMVTQKVYCSPTANSTLWIGEISGNAMLFYPSIGISGFTLNANIYTYGAQIISVFDPLQAGNRQVSYGAYASTEAYASGGFAVGDHVVDSFHVSETKVMGKTLLTCNDPFATCRGYDITFNGYAFSKALNIINNNAATNYKDENPSSAVGFTRPTVFALTGEFGPVFTSTTTPSSLFVQSSNAWPSGLQVSTIWQTAGGQIFDCFAPVTTISDSINASVTPAVLTINAAFFPTNSTCDYLPGMHVKLANFPTNTVLNASPVNYGTILTVGATQITVALNPMYSGGTIGLTTEAGTVSTPSFLVAYGGQNADFQMGTLNTNEALSSLFVTDIGTAIASASTITPLTGLQHVTGTAAISLMVPPLGCAASRQSCLVKLWPDAAWTTVTGSGVGSFASATTAIVGKTLACDYDPALTKWACSY